MQFTYTARDAQGKTLQGTIDSVSRFTAAKELRDRGILPLSLTEIKTEVSFSDKFAKFFGKVKLHEKIIFTHNLAGMLKAGLPLFRAIEVLKKQNKNPALEDVFVGLLSTIDKGGTLSDGFAKFPKVFSPLMVSMVRAGEESGNLSNTLGDIGVNLQKTYDLNRKIKSAMMYPSIIVAAIFIIATLMLMFVVPTLTKIFKEFGTALPASTKFVIFISDSVANHPFIFLGVVGVLVVGGMYIFRSEKLKPKIDALTLKLPAIGMLIKEVNTARTARTLSTLLTSGVEMTRALTITKEVLQNVHYREVIEKANLAVQKGSSLSSVFKDNQDLYPVMMGEMIAVGEETGALSQMLSDIAIYYEEEVDAKTKDMSTIIEPVLMVFIGGAVGFFAISMISPMYGLVSAIG